jgi:hypothetical protein
VRPDDRRERSTPRPRTVGRCTIHPYMQGVHLNEWGQVGFGRTTRSGASFAGRTHCFPGPDRCGPR